MWAGNSKLQIRVSGFIAPDYIAKLDPNRLILRRVVNVDTRFIF
jgi:hypothetical protein